MNFLLDHDVPIDVLRVLQRAGHQAQRSVEFLGREALDAEIFELAKSRKFILRTQLDLAARVGLIDSQVSDNLIVLTRKVSAMLYKLIQVRKDKFV